MNYEALTTTGTAGTLAIDTSTEQAGIALTTGSGVISHSWPASRAQTTTVLPEIDRLISQAGMQPKDITALVVAIGPGTFTGLRVGLAIAKGIVAASKIPLVGVPTLDIVLASHSGENIIAVLPAGRGRMVWQRAGDPPVNASVPEMIAAMSSLPNVRLIGEMTDDQATEIATAGISSQREYRDPAVLLNLGIQRLSSGAIDDPITLEPLYLHGVTVAAPPIVDKLRRKE